MKMNIEIDGKIIHALLSSGHFHTIEEAVEKALKTYLLLADEGRKIENQRAKRTGTKGELMEYKYLIH